jgi:hypothetical protein
VDEDERMEGWDWEYIRDLAGMGIIECMAWNIYLALFFALRLALEMLDERMDRWKHILGSWLIVASVGDNK